MGLLPAYVDLTSIGWADACLVAALAAGVIAVVKFSYALLAQRARLWMTRPGAARGLHVGASLLLLAAAVMLVLPGPTNT